jgi:hypothetical protein
MAPDSAGGEQSCATLGTTDAHYASSFSGSCDEKVSAANQYLGTLYCGVSTPSAAIYW